jgi:UrcA family protein
MSTSVIPRAAGSRFKIALLMLAGSFGCALAAGVASAATDNDAPSVVVRFSSESLATDRGAQQIYGRILAAAKQVCPDAYSLKIVVSVGAQACRAQAVAQAIQQIGNSRLAAVHATRSKNG